jgi:L-ascorbate 6-phosphate lactonase
MEQGWVVPEHRTVPDMAGEELRQAIEETTVERGEVAVCWLTQASWLVKFRTCTVLIDPWWRDLEAGDQWGKLLGEFPLAPDEFPHIDYIFCTHWHDDHICPTTLPKLAEQFPAAKFVVPLRSRKMIIEMGIPRGRIHSMHGNDSGQLSKGLSFFSIPAAHEELDVDDRGAHTYLGFLIRCDGTTVFHMGDSRPYPNWVSNIQRAARLLCVEGTGEAPIDIAMLCINGNDNLRHDEACDLAEILDVGLAIPMHYGMDPGNTVDPQIFVDEVESRGDKIPYMIATPGEIVIMD